MAAKEAAKAEKLAAKEAAKAEKLAAKEEVKEEEMTTLETDSNEKDLISDGDTEEAPTLELDIEMSEEEEEEEGDTEVEEFTWEGVDYIIDPESGLLYDKEVFEESGEGAVVGKYFKDKNEVKFM